MKVIVFGATGSIGRQVVAQALEQGHLVTAFSRHPDALHLQHPHLKECQGDVLNLGVVEQAVQDQEAVICVLGSGKKLTGTLRSEGTRNIIQAMEQTGVHRLICQSTLGTGDSWGNLDFYWKYLMFGFVLRQVFIDHEKQEHLVQQSNLDWTIIRPSNFIDGQRTGQYHHGFPGDKQDLKLSISRADVADFILKQLVSDRYLGKMPSLSY